MNTFLPPPFRSFPCIYGYYLVCLLVSTVPFASTKDENFQTCSDPTWRYHEILPIVPSDVLFSHGVSEPFADNCLQICILSLRRHLDHYSDLDLICIGHYISTYPTCTNIVCTNIPSATLTLRPTPARPVSVLQVPWIPSCPVPIPSRYSSGRASLPGGRQRAC